MSVNDAVAERAPALERDASTGSKPTAESPAGEKATAATTKIWFDGELIDAGGLDAALNTHALHYGSGVFEGIRAYATRNGAAVFRLPEHLERMRKGADLLGMQFDIGEATEAVLQTLRANRLGDAYIRPLAWYGAGNFGLDVSGRPQHLMVATSATNLHLGGNRTRVSVSSWRRNPASSLPPLKLCGAYVNSILAKREAKSRGSDEAMFIDDAGDVVECTGANLFIVRKGEVTAVAHRDALPGITRDTIIALTGAASRKVSLQELLEADEVFACGTAAEVAPISEIEAGIGGGEARTSAASSTAHRQYGDNPITREITALYAQAVRGETPQAAVWLTRV
jgi:branched-chain amino acid aminotransferase